MSRKSLYTYLIAPRSKDPQIQNREVILNILLLGTISLACAALLVLVAELLKPGHTYILPRLIVCGFVTLFMLTLYWLSRHRQYKWAAHIFVALYMLIVAAMIWLWGIQIPQGILLAAFVIILSGVLLGSRYALYAAVANILVLVAAYSFTTPDTSWKNTPAIGGDIVVFGVTFAQIALVCYLYNHQIEKSFQRAERSEAALRRQRDLLEVKVEERTKKLQAVQLEQIQQVYRFAELGLVSTAMLHDLANHLSSLSLDIEGLKAEKHILDRIKNTISYIDVSVQKTRQQLHGEEAQHTFVVSGALREVVKICLYRAQQQKVELTLDDQLGDAALLGDELRFKQMLTNIIANAIDASTEAKPKKRQAEVRAKVTKTKVVITVTDNGKGITPTKQKRLFEPFHSTKKQGMGLGLFMAKEIAERGFGGGISAVREKDQTVFTISIPLIRT